jgi:stearoyl-CoA desaturase (delta-9 desaturase)
VRDKPFKEGFNYQDVSFIVLVHLVSIYGFMNFNMEAFWIVLIGHFITCCIGITFGFHRLFSHRSFKASKPVEYIAALCGTLAGQGTILEWVSHHRMHHAGSDTEKDPHNASRGFWYSHLFWFFEKRKEFDDPRIQRAFARDIVRDPILNMMSSRNFLGLAQLLLGIGLYQLGGLDYVIWGIACRLVVSYHITWCVNSACHVWGYKNFEIPGEDRATNVWWVGILAWGEGWHNNHHAYGESARAGYKWWEIDITYMVIKLLQMLGQASDLKLPMADVDVNGKNLEAATSK